MNTGGLSPSNRSLNSYLRSSNDLETHISYPPIAPVQTFNGYFQYGEGPTDPYDLYSSVYTIPSSHGVENGSANVRDWGSLNPKKSSEGGLFVEQDPPSVDETSSLPLLTAPMTRPLSFTNNGNTFYHQVAPPSSSSAVPPLFNSRALPQPGGPNEHRSSVISNGQDVREDPVSLRSDVSSTNHPPKIHNALGSQETLVSTDPRKPSNVSSIGHSTSSVDRASSKDFSSISSASSVPYIAIAHSPVLAIRSESGHFRVANDASNSSVTSSEYVPAPSIFPSVVPDTQAQRNTSFHNLYSYTSDSGYRRDYTRDSTGLDEGTLSSGQTYTRLYEPQPRPIDSPKALSRDDEAHSQITHRASVDSFRN